MTESKSIRKTSDEDDDDEDEEEDEDNNKAKPSFISESRVLTLAANVPLRCILTIVGAVQFVTRLHTK
ncbi:hypothetical protein CPLU01_09502 [Colletotrichum plurivorum]|uniref:Uncharacterized protein n=1 Tax=Colletotrichum plurivorum TaxID=2175906 RepID=A0A8H6K936_9PEZI|nr:hypothetical protein CPLU01_09502 [Colletotrichum plurivorum]